MRFAQKIEHQGVEGLEPVLVLLVVAQQNVLFQEEQVVAAAFHKGDAVGEHFVGALLLLAEKRLAPAAQIVFLELIQDLIDVLAHLAKDIAPVGLQIGRGAPS